MKKSYYSASVLVFLLYFILACDGAPEGKDLLPVPTHADAVVVLTKHAGLFDRYVSEDATLNECVAFMNRHGIFFGLMEVVNGAEFTLKDCARVMGQIELVLTGEAEYSAGKVMLPKGIDSWEEFCIMDGVEYRQGYDSIVKVLLEVRKLKQ